MSIFKKFFHKHNGENVSCPFTGNTYVMCSVCGIRMGVK